MKYLLPSALFAAALFSSQNCADKSGDKAPKAALEAPQGKPVAAPIALPSGFNEYWYAGQAELCTYDVTQERYGEIRSAEQVNVFVTEDLSASKQVKLDDPASAGPDRVPVLKLNSIRRFHTGIYDYSLMQSIFSPISGTPTLKTSTTVQDWCGQVFIQNNLEKNGYHLRSFSYFETEGDQDLHLPLDMLEESLWTRLRLNPWDMPTGAVNVLPSALYSRLRHKPYLSQKAELSIEKGAVESTLKLHYLDISRDLKIVFQTAFPFKITGWEEIIEGKLASKGTLKATRKSAYWGEHDNVHAPLRDSLKLRF